MCGFGKEFKNQYKWEMEDKPNSYVLREILKAPIAVLHLRSSAHTCYPRKHYAKAACMIDETILIVQFYHDKEMLIK